jgi:hypothetical protein
MDLEYPELELSNSLAESSLRPVARSEDPDPCRQSTDRTDATGTAGRQACTVANAQRFRIVEI